MTNKQFPLIPYKGGFIVVDNDPILEGDYIWGGASVWKNLDCIIFPNYKKILFASPSLNLPLPVITIPGDAKSDLDILTDHCEILIKSNKDYIESWVEPFIKGVYAVFGRINSLKNKAAQRGFSESQAKSLIEFVKSLEYMDGSKIQSEFTADDILRQFNSLSKKPTVVIVEMICKTCYPDKPIPAENLIGHKCENNMGIKTFINTNGKEEVKVVQVKYE